LTVKLDRHIVEAREAQRRDSEPMTTPDNDRAALIAGLRGLADFLAEHPDAPVPPAYPETCITVFPDGDTDDERRAGVDDAAAVLDSPAADPAGSGHYTAARKFGPVTYEVLAISDARRAVHEAGSSYYNSVVPDTHEVAA
jgi:hypothetical protein